MVLRKERRREPSPRLLCVGHAVSGHPSTPQLARYSRPQSSNVVWSQILFAEYAHSFECVLTYPSMRRQRWVFIDF